MSELAANLTASHNANQARALAAREFIADRCPEMIDSEGNPCAWAVTACIRLMRRHNDELRGFTRAQLQAERLQIMPPWARQDAASGGPS